MPIYHGRSRGQRRHFYLDRIVQSSPESSGGPGYVNRRMTMRFDVTMAKINEIIRLKDEEEEALQQQQLSIVLQKAEAASSSTAATIKRRRRKTRH